VVDREDVTSSLEVDAVIWVTGVIWATGYRPNYSWSGLPIFDEDDWLRHRRGVTDVPGSVLPRPHLAVDALIGGVGDDADLIHRACRWVEGRKEAGTRARA
jgi:putative flavoprotein involved in K+ transport